MLSPGRSIITIYRFQMTSAAVQHVVRRSGSAAQAAQHQANQMTFSSIALAASQGHRCRDQHHPQTELCWFHQFHRTSKGDIREASSVLQQQFLRLRCIEGLLEDPVGILSLIFVYKLETP